jgi:predicted ester cyclase
MSLEENKSIVRRHIEEYNEARDKPNFDLYIEQALDEFMTPDYFDHTNQVGLEGVKQLFIMGNNGFPDWHENIEDIIAEGDKVWVRLTYTATHTGEFFGIAPTGKKIKFSAVAIYRIVNDKLVEGWFVSESFDFLKQLGAIEYTEEGKKMFPENYENT